MLEVIMTIVRKIFKRKKKSVHWQGVPLPMIRETFSHLISSDLISIQPMPFRSYEPDNVYSRNVIIEKSGFRTKTDKKHHIYGTQIFYIDFKYNKDIFLPVPNERSQPDIGRII
jgi:hypothetical protein